MSKLTSKMQKEPRPHGWKAKGVVWQSVDAWYQQELQTTASSTRNYERTTYYADTWLAHKYLT